MRYFILVISCVCILSRGFAQNQEFTKVNIAANTNWDIAAKSIKKGDKIINKEPTSSRLAIPYYLDAYKINPNSASLNYKLSVCYLESYEPYKALPYAKKAFELNPEFTPDMEFILAQAYHKADKFDSAMIHYRNFRPNASKLPGFDLSWIDKLMYECTNGITLSENPMFKIRHLDYPINTDASEYVPLLRADGEYMYYTARVIPSATPKKISKFDYAPYETLYKAKKVSDTSFSEVSKVDLIRDAINRHEACVSLSADGKTMYFYNGTNKQEIRYSEFIDGNWTASKPVLGIDSKGYETHISVSSDGQRAYVVSNRPGGFGGRDIYEYTKISDEEWGNPKNLGEVINTPYDEDGVFIHPDGKTLYFSSRGHNSMGGYDVFYSVLENGIWSKPVNLGAPVNTGGDDIYFVITGDGRTGYLSSSRVGGHGDQDIYQFELIDADPNKPNDKYTGPSLNMFKGLVVDKTTKEPISAKVVIVDNSTGKEIFKYRSDKEEGFLVSLPSGINYGISLNADGYIFHSENIDLRDATGYSESTKIIELSRIEVGGTFVLNNVFFDFDKAELKSESVAELNRALAILKQYPDIRIEIAGHTDSYGSNEYNSALSQRRVEAVKRYLINNGLAAVRIVKVKGYGEEVPIDTNETPEGRARNRRVEFKIVEK